MRTLLLGLAAAAPAAGQCTLLKALASDAAPGAGFAHALALAGPLAAVGAADHGAAGTAYVFDVQSGAELWRLAPADLPAGAQFGNALALGAGHLAVGAVLDDDLGPAAGAVHVFDLSTGQRVHELLASDGAPFDLFGISVAIAGGRVLVGADGHDLPVSDGGALYVFDLASGAELAKLTPADLVGGDRFGGSVAAHGDRALVGAWNQTVGAKSGAGAAYLLDLVTGTVSAKLVPFAGAPWDQFGLSVALGPEWAVVGAPRTDHQGANSGAAWVFDAASGAELQELLPGAGGPADFFGQAVALAGDLALVGAPFYDGAASEAGGAWVFDLAAGGVELGTLLPGGLAQDDTLGFALAMDRDDPGGAGGAATRALLGAKGDDEGGAEAGAAYLMAVRGPDCNENGSPDACDLADGTSTDADGDGIPDECAPPTWRRWPGNGHWYALTPPSNWVGAEARAQAWGGHLATVRSPTEDAWLGQVFAGVELFVGYTDVFVEGAFEWISGEPPGYEAWAPGEPDDDPGAADFTARDPAAGGAWRDVAGQHVARGVAELLSDDCDGDLLPDAYELAVGLEQDWNGDGVPDACVPATTCAATVNSTGRPATIAALGTPEVAANDVTLEALDVPPGQLGYYLMSQGEDFVPGFGGSQGNLCLGAPILRLVHPPAGGVLSSGSEGRLTLPLDLTLVPPGGAVSAGERWYFQAWFRDFVPVIGATSNTTPGFELLFR